MLLAAVEHGSDADSPPIVLLHGMFSSARYWDLVVAELDGRHVVTLDLLGFGDSPAPRSACYDYTDHVDAVSATLESLAVRTPLTIVGHSMGALIALRLAVTRPELASRLVLIGMPVYPSRQAARAAIIQDSLIRRIMLYGLVSRTFCAVWCRALRPLSRRVAPLYVRKVPAAAASATVQHSWRSYSRSLRHVVEEQSVRADLDRLACPTLVVIGDQDISMLTPQEPAGSYPSDRIRAVRMEGGHHLPIERPDTIARLISQPANTDKSRTVARPLVE